MNTNFKNLTDFHKYFKDLENLISILNKELKDIKDLLGTGFTKVSNNFDSIVIQINTLHRKIDFLTKKVDLLEGTTNVGLEDVGLKLENLTDEITKISVVTRFSEEFENLNRLS